MPRWATRLHAWVYRRSGGRLLGRMGGQPVLLLQTTGRRSGRTRATPVQYLADGDTFVIVASNAGAARPPAWYLNLRANPHARIRVGARNIDIQAHEAAGQERVTFWRRMTAANATWSVPSTRRDANCRSWPSPPRLRRLRGQAHRDDEH